MVSISCRVAETPEVNRAKAIDVFFAGMVIPHVESGSVGVISGEVQPDARTMAMTRNKTYFRMFIHHIQTRYY
jgi:hypothetical protein